MLYVWLKRIRFLEKVFYKSTNRYSSNILRGVLQLLKEVLKYTGRCHGKILRCSAEVLRGNLLKYCKLFYKIAERSSWIYWEVFKNTYRWSLETAARYSVKLPETGGVMIYENEGIE